MGREEFLNVPLHILTLAEDFFGWNSFPWGEYMWRYFYKRTLNVVENHAEKKDPKKMTTYNLNRFVWALKIWILESYPKSILWWAKQTDVIPRGLAWSNFKLLLLTSGELKADWLVRSQYYFNGEDAPFIKFVKPKCSDFQRFDSKDCTLVEQAKKPNCSTSVQVDAVINQDVPLVQETQDVLGNVGSSNKGLLEPKIMDTVELLCKQLIDVRREMNGMVDHIKSKVIDTLTTTFESARKHTEVVEAEVVNCETNLVECPVVKKDVGVLCAAVVSCKMNLFDCPVVQEDISDPKNLTYRDTQPSTMEHLVNACAFFSPPLPFYDSLKADKFVEPAQVKDTQNGELTVSLYEEQITNDNSDFDKLLKDGNMNLDKLIADVTKSENKSLQMIKASEVNVVKGDGKPVLGKVFEAIRRIKKPEFFKQAPYMQQRPTTPQVKKKRKRFNNLKPIDFSLSVPFELDGSLETLQPFKEVLRRHCKSNPNKVTVPTCMKCFLRNGVGPKQMYKFPWVNYGFVVDVRFWLALLRLDENRRGWMLDDVDLEGLGGVEGQVEELGGVEGPGEELRRSLRSSFHIKYPQSLS
ncbi:hypothetical protein Tco_0045208 [Tanacetum coccineum]